MEKVIFFKKNYIVIQNTLRVLTISLQVVGLALSSSRFNLQNYDKSLLLFGICFAFLLMCFSKSWKDFGRNLVFSVAPIPIYLTLLNSIVWVLSFFTHGFDINTIKNFGLLFGIFGALFSAILLFAWPLILGAIGLNAARFSYAKIRK